MTERIGSWTELVISKDDLGRWIAWLIIVGPALLDLLHGFLDIEYEISVVAALYRLTILVGGIFALATRPRKSIAFVVLFYVIFLVFELIVWSVNSQVRLLAELESFANVFYLPLCYILLSFTMREMGVTQEQIIRQVITYGKITATIVVLSLIFDIGIPTYSTQTGSIYGFGTQSYYTAGNVLGLTLIVSLAVSIHRFLKDCQLRNFLESILIFAGAFSIGSRTGMFVSFLLMATGILYFVFLSSGQGRRRAIVALLFVPLFIYGGFKSYQFVSQYSLMTSKLELLLTVDIRSAHKASGWEYVSTKGLATHLTGSSYQVYVREFAMYTPKRNVQSATAEVDPVDVLAAYGVVGLVALYLPYVMGIAISGLNYVVTRHSAYISSFVGLSLILGHSLLAGHVLFSSAATQFACIFFVLAFSSTRHSEFSQVPRRQQVAE